MGILTIAIPTKQFEQTARFYADTLGLIPLYRTDAVCLVHAGAIYLSIRRINPADPLAPTGHGYILNLLVRDLPAIRERLQKTGITAQQEWADGPFRHLLVADPDGNLLQLVEHLTR